MKNRRISKAAHRADARKVADLHNGLHNWPNHPHSCIVDWKSQLKFYLRPRCIKNSENKAHSMYVFHKVSYRSLVAHCPTSLYVNSTMATGHQAEANSHTAMKERWISIVLHSFSDDKYSISPFVRNLLCLLRRESSLKMKSYYGLTYNDTHTEDAFLCIPT
jgi:hypothetical protein